MLITYSQVVLADFGIATKEREDDYNIREVIGTPHWTPPETPKACLTTAT